MVEGEKKPLRFRIYYGYGKQDYMCITENELERAKYAWQTGSLFSQGVKEVSGSEFKRIEPDFRFYTGWYDTYEPKDTDDFSQMRSLMPPEREFEQRKSLADVRVRFILENGRTELLSVPNEVDKLLLR